MNKPLDDLKDILHEQKKESTSNPILGVVFLLLAISVLVAAFVLDRTSETELVEASYLFMPLFAMAFASMYCTLRKTFVIGLLSIAGLFVFYELIWPSL